MSTPATAFPTVPPRAGLAAALPKRWSLALVCAVVFAVVPLLRFGLGAKGLVGIFLVAVLAVLALKDVEERRVPNVIVLPATAIVLIAVAALRPHHLLQAVVAAVGAAAFLFLPSLVTGGGVGLGDVKLAALLGAALGWGVAAALLLGCLAASVVGVALVLRRGASARKTFVPFVPFLALGAVAAIALGAPLSL
jgi:prepilin signal peptidase PulO-like enzyme (type II secretory pathway)